MTLRSIVLEVVNTLDAFRLSSYVVSCEPLRWFRPSLRVAADENLTHSLVQILLQGDFKVCRRPSAFPSGNLVHHLVHTENMPTLRAVVSSVPGMSELFKLENLNGETPFDLCVNKMRENPNTGMSLEAILQIVDTDPNNQPASCSETLRPLVLRYLKHRELEKNPESFAVVSAVLNSRSSVLRPEVDSYCLNECVRCPDSRSVPLLRQLLEAGLHPKFHYSGETNDLCFVASSCLPGALEKMKCYTMPTPIPKKVLYSVFKNPGVDSFAMMRYLLGHPVEPSLDQFPIEGLLSNEGPHAFEMFQHILGMGFDLTRLNQEGNDLLHLAVSNTGPCAFQMASHLLQMGFSATAKTANTGRLGRLGDCLSPIQALFIKYEYFNDISEFQRLVQLLVQHGAAISSAYWNVIVPLGSSVTEEQIANSKSLFSFLLNNGLELVDKYSISTVWNLIDSQTANIDVKNLILKEMFKEHLERWNTLTDPEKKAFYQLAHPLCRNPRYAQFFNFRFVTNTEPWYQTLNVFVDEGEPPEIRTVIHQVTRPDCTLDQFLEAARRFVLSQESKLK